jgi:hypothetical protein
LKFKKRKIRDRGAALLIVLFIVMTITVLSLGFMSRCDTELACGQNTVLREQMDSLAYSGLEQARGLLLYPQDSAAIAAGNYWTGASGQQLASGNDYYDVTVAMHTVADTDPAYRCTYDVNSEAYRLKSGTKVGRSSIAGEFRIDQCIAYRADAGVSIPSRVTVNGDVYCNGNLLNLGVINGDVYANALSGSASGQTKAIAQSTVLWPNVTVADFTSKYAVQSLPATVSGTSYGPYTPVKVCYYNGTLTLGGNAVIEGMLVVNGDLQVSGTGNSITAGKNLPALYVTGDIIIQDFAELTVNGLAVVENRVKIRPSAGNVNVYGGLFTKEGLFETAVDSTVNANTAFLYNGPAWSGGQVGGAVQFDGVDDYLQTTNSSTTLQITNDYTVSVWVKPDASQKSWAGIFSKTDSGGSNNDWTLQFDTSSPRKVVMYHPSGSWDTGIRITDIAGAWHNIRVVRGGSGTPNLMRSYLDGILKSSATFNNAPGWGNGHLNIGGDMTASSSYVFKGLIDELAIYNQAATGANDIPAGLIGAWNFDKSGTGTVNIHAMPNKTAVIVWSGSTATRWGQAGGAFFRTIRRN